MYTTVGLILFSETTCCCDQEKSTFSSWSTTTSEVYAATVWANSPRIGNPRSSNNHTVYLSIEGFVLITKNTNTKIYRMYC